MKNLMLICILFTFGNIIYAQDKIKQNDTVKGDKMVKQHEPNQIKEADLLSQIKFDLANNYSGAKVEDAWKFEYEDVITYKVTIKDNNVKWNLLYDKDGKLISKSKLLTINSEKPPDNNKRFN